MNWKAVLLTFAIIPAPLQAQTSVNPKQFGFMAADAARDQFNAGRDYFDDHKYAQAETVLRDLIRKYPRNAITDSGHYYLIRTLSKQGKVAEAKKEIEIFEKTYRKSPWLTDVKELSVQLSKEVSPQMMLSLTPPAAVAATAPTAPTPPAPVRVFPGQGQAPTPAAPVRVG